MSDQAVVLGITWRESTMAFRHDGLVSLTTCKFVLNDNLLLELYSSYLGVSEDVNMQSRDFCFWLQGFFELSDAAIVSAAPNCRDFAAFGARFSA